MINLFSQYFDDFGVWSVFHIRRETLDLGTRLLRTDAIILFNQRPNSAKSLQDWAMGDAILACLETVHRSAYVISQSARIPSLAGIRLSYTGDVAKKLFESRHFWARLRGQEVEPVKVEIVDQPDPNISAAFSPVIRALEASSVTQPSRPSQRVTGPCQATSDFGHKNGT